MGLIVTSVLSLVVMLLSLVFSVGLLVSGASGGVEGVTPPEVVQVRIVWELILLVCNTVVIAGALQMMRLRDANLARGACVLALVPCCGPCMVLGIPFGAWGLYVMRDPEVTAAFGRST